MTQGDQTVTPAPGALRRPLARNAVRGLLLSLLAACLLTAHLGPPATEGGHALLRLLQTMTLLALITASVLTRRQGRPAQAPLLAVPVLGLLLAGTVGADTLMNGAVSLLIQFPVTCAAVMITVTLLVLAALLAEALSEHS